MSLGFVVVGIPAHILQPLCSIAKTNRYRVNEDTVVEFPAARLVVTIERGEITFDPPLKVTYRMFTVEASKARIDIKEGVETIVLDLKLSPIDVRFIPQ